MSRSGRARSFEFRLRLGLMQMLLPLALVGMALLAGLLWVRDAQDDVRSEFADELSTISELRQQLGHAAQLVTAFEASGDSRYEGEVEQLVASMDEGFARMLLFDEAEEVELATSAAEAWRGGVSAAEEMFAADGSGVQHAARAVEGFDRAAMQLADLDRVSRAEIEATLAASGETTHQFVVGAIVAGFVVSGVNHLLIRRLLAATSAPLRQLADDVAVFSVTNLDRRIAVDGDAEFEAVGDAFNSMADRLQDSLGTLEHQAFHDALTGLPNRASLVRQLAQPARPDRAVLLFDLDGFKAVNDGLGHAAGDETLIHVGHRIERALRPGDLVARLGGDEFAVVLDNESSVVDVESCARRILLKIAEPIEIAGRAIVLDASVGITQAAAGEDPTEAIRRADIALYVAKEAGKGVVRQFHPDMLRNAEQKLKIETDLRTAVDRGEIEVHYQPTVCIATGQVTGVEALARWRHPQHGLIQPLTFIPVAEANGQILALGRFVLETACRQARAWQQLPGLGQLSVAVNVSARQLHDPVIVDDVADALRRSGLVPASLTLEVTESVMADPDAVARVHLLKALGVRVALDDFGTGYSSLSYLQRLPIDIIKIDKSFIDDLGSRADRAVLANAIVRLGQTLGLETVAEGVERDEQLRVLSAAGCDTVQGFLFARPDSPTHIESRLLELTTAPVSADGDDDADGLVHVEVGPLDAVAAREWLRHAHWAVDELEAGRLLAQPVPTAVLAVMRDYLHRWSLIAMAGDTFSWTAHEDARVLDLLMHHWLPVSQALAAATRKGAFVMTEDAGRFSEAMVHTILMALARDDRSHAGVNAAVLAREWPTH